MMATEARNTTMVTAMATWRQRMKSILVSFGRMCSGNSFMCVSSRQMATFWSFCGGRRSASPAHGDRGEHGGENTDDHGQREALQRTGTECSATPTIRPVKLASRMVPEARS